MIPTFTPCNGPGSNQVGSLTAGGQNVQCMEQSGQVLRNPTGSLGAPTIMQLSHWDRNRHPPQYYRGAINWIHTCPICPMALSSFTASLSEAQAIPYSIALSVPTQPALPPTHPPTPKHPSYILCNHTTNRPESCQLPHYQG